MGPVLIFAARRDLGTERKIYARSNSERVNSRWQLIPNSPNTRTVAFEGAGGSEKKGFARPG